MHGKGIFHWRGLGVLLVFAVMAVPAAAWGAAQVGSLLAEAGTEAGQKLVWDDDEPSSSQTRSAQAEAATEAPADQAPAASVPEESAAPAEPVEQDSAKAQELIWDEQPKQAGAGEASSQTARQEKDAREKSESLNREAGSTPEAVRPQTTPRMHIF